MRQRKFESIIWSDQCENSRGKQRIQTCTSKLMGQTMQYGKHSKEQITVKWVCGKMSLTRSAVFVNYQRMRRVSRWPAQRKGVERRTVVVGWGSCFEQQWHVVPWQVSVQLYIMHVHTTYIIMHTYMCVHTHSWHVHMMWCDGYGVPGTPQVFEDWRILQSTKKLKFIFWHVRVKLNN